MTHAYICDAIRTPFGRYGGTLSSVRTDDLGAIRALRDELDVEDPNHVAIYEVEQLIESIGGDDAIGELDDDRVDRGEQIVLSDDLGVGHDGFLSTDERIGNYRLPATFGRLEVHIRPMRSRPLEAQVGDARSSSAPWSCLHPAPR